MTQWTYNNNIFVCENLKDYEGFVYLITNLTNGRKYIGKKSFWQRRKDRKTGRRKTSESDWKNYWSSSDELKNDVTQLGYENFSREILHLCKYKKALSYYEEKLQWQYQVLESDEWYNTNIGGKYFVTETKKIYGIEYKITTKNDKWRHIKSEQMKGENNTAKSPEVRQKISEKLKGKNNPRYGQKNSIEQTQAIIDSCKNTVFMNKNNINKRVKSDLIEEYLHNGWVIGRADLKNVGRKLGYSWYTNGILNIHVYPGDDIPLEYYKGRTL
jgi:hypothetical protein